MPWFLALVMLAGICLLFFGSIGAGYGSGADENKYAACVLTGLALIVGATLKFAWIAYQALRNIGT